MTALGWHWMATAEGCHLTAITDLKLISELLIKLSLVAELTPVSSPLVQTAEAGPVGVILLAESHASIHVNCATRTVFVDIFSCTYFSAVNACQVLRSALHPQTINERYLERGSVEPQLETASRES